MVDTLPEGLQAIAASHGGEVSADGSLVTWTLPDIGPGVAGAVTVDAQVSRIVTDVMTNVATLSSAELPDEQAAATLSTLLPSSVPVPIDRRWLWLMGVLLGALAARYRLIARTAH